MDRNLKQLAQLTLEIQFEKELRWLEIVFIFPRLVLQILFQIQFTVYRISLKFTTVTNETS